MNKRWIGILIILLAGLGCMYIIVCNSTTVGSAVSVIEDVTVTLPPGYVTTEGGTHFCQMGNGKTKESIRIKSVEGNTSYMNEFNKRLKTLAGDYDIVINKNYTNKTVAVIEYTNQSTEKNDSSTLVFFDKCDHTFSMRMKHFTDEGRKESAMNFIIDNMKYDFKQRI
jgi:hypothetical protein